jgi:hypothetical protein
MTPDTIQDELKDIRIDIRELRREIHRYKGFLGGVMWSFVAMAACVQFIFLWIKG